MTETREFFWTNNAATELAAPINDSVTSVSVVDGSVFPALTTGIFTVVLRDDSLGKFEILNVTGRSGNTLTVERGAEGTTAASWGSGHKIRHSLTAAWFQSRGYTAPLVEVTFIDDYTVAGTGVAPVEVDVYGDLAGTAIGDLVIVCVAHARVTGGTFLTEASAGWETFIPSYSNGNYAGTYLFQHLSIFYRVLDGTETTPAEFSLTGAPGATFPFSVHAMAWRNVDPIQPFDFMSLKAFPGGTAGSGTNLAGPPVRMHIASRSACIGGFLSFTDTDSAVVETVNSPTSLLSSFSVDLPAVGYSEYASTRVWARYCRRNELSNLFGGQDDETQPTKGWASVGMTTPTFESVGANCIAYSARANGGAVRHCFYKSVTLEAGEEYTYAVAFTYNQSSNRRAYISVEPPAASEFGCYWSNSSGYTLLPTNIGAGFTEVFCSEYAGSGDNDTRVAAGVFTASVSGTYLFRYGMLDTVGGLTYSAAAASSDEIYFHKNLLRKGRYPIPFTTLDSASEGQIWEDFVLPYTLNTSGLESDQGRCMWALTLTPSPSALDGYTEAQVYENTFCADDLLGSRYPGSGRLKAGRKRAHSSTVTDFFGWAIDRIVPPAIAGVPGHYYFEITMDVLHSPDADAQKACMVAPVFSAAAQPPSKINIYSDKGAYGLRLDGTLLVNGAYTGGATGTLANGDVVGMRLDLGAGMFYAYVNGTLRGSTALEGAAAQASLWWRAGVHGHQNLNEGLEFTANLTGPFLYDMNGASAWDWQNEVGTP